MSSGFQVMVADLAQASGTFHDEAGVLTAVMPPDGPACPNCGGDGADEALQTVVEALGALHMQLASVIDGHAQKLQTAHDKYPAARSR